MGFQGLIRVSEIFGIRRFLYPVSVEIPASTLDNFPGADQHRGGSQFLGLFMPDGRRLPVQATPGERDPELFRRLDFAVSMAPFEKLELKLLSGTPGLPGEENFQIQKTISLDDPLRITEENRFKSVQSRFKAEFDRLGTLHEVVYDCVPHLRGPAVFIRNGRQAVLKEDSAFAVGCPLGARVKATGEYYDGCGAETRLEITACKSWVMLTHVLSGALSGDELILKLPMAVSSPNITCDFGAGGGIYGNLNRETSPEVVWHSDFSKSGGVRWSIASGERVDYIGKVKREDYLKQQWFHQIDGEKALAVALTQIPVCCSEIKVTLQASGNVAVAFKVGEGAEMPAAFGLCCHFLNNIPAISAATNPQSILLPPVVKWECA